MAVWSYQYLLLGIVSRVGAHSRIQSGLPVRYDQKVRDWLVLKCVPVHVRIRVYGNGLARDSMIQLWSRQNCWQVEVSYDNCVDFYGRILVPIPSVVVLGWSCCKADWHFLVGLAFDTGPKAGFFASHIDQTSCSSWAHFIKIIITTTDINATPCALKIWIQCIWTI